jgi:glycosyltransferase involved in cell wall biosynthesis
MDDVRTVIISTELPVAPMTGGRIRTHYLARTLSRVGPVTVAGFTLDGERPRLPTPLQAAAVPWSPPPLYAEMASADPAVAARAYAQLAQRVSEPWIASCYESRPLRETIRALCEDGVDLVVVEHSLMASYLDEIPRDVPTVLDLHNVHSVEVERASRRGLEAPAEARRVREFEASAIARSTLTLAVSELEAEAARRIAPGARVEVVRNGVDTSFFGPGRAPASPGYMLFTGLMNYRPNVEAVEWFAAEVLPRVETGVLHVVGSRPSPAVNGLASARLVVHGEVADTRPFQHRARVVVVPLLSGAGTRLKILEAAACGNAIVSTSLGAEGLDLLPGRDILIADRPGDFAAALTAVLADDGLRARLGRHARTAVRRYRWESIGEQFLGLVQPLSQVHAI